MAQADKRLYRAKHNGKNQVVLPLKPAPRRSSRSARGRLPTIPADGHPGNLFVVGASGGAASPAW